jgi:hypothetical protein
MIKGANENVHKTFFALESLALTTTTFIEDQRNETYPDGFITIPHVEYHLGSARHASQAILLGYAPHIVGTEEHDLWIQYVRENIGWVEDAYDVNPARPPQQSPDQDFDQEFFETHVWRNRISLDGAPLIVDDETYLQCPARAEPNLGPVYEYNVENPSNGIPLAPVWMTSPPPNPGSDLSTTNFNFLSNPSFRLATETIEQTGKSTFEDICEDPATL